MEQGGTSWHLLRVKAALLLLGVLLVGCRSRGTLVKPEPAHSAEPGAMPRRLPDSPASSAREIVLEDHPSTASSARYVAIAFGQDPASKPGVRSLGEHSADRHPHRDGVFLTHPTFDAGELALAIPGGGEGASWSVHLIRDEATAPRTIPLGKLQPTALHRVGRALFLGVLEEETPRLGWLDLDEKMPSFRELNTHGKLPRFKAYDLFARSGSRLLAIDDVVTPIYADWIELDAQGHPSHSEPWTLPSFINGHYTLAALTPSGKGLWNLFAVGRYGIMSGSGHDLVRMTVQNRTLKESGVRTINSSLGGSSELPVIEEHVPRGTMTKELRITGDRFTEWTGLAFDPSSDQVLVAAGDRGLFSFASSLPKTTTPTVIDVGGECHDVRLLEPGIALALVSKEGRTTLVVIRFSDKTPSVIARHELSGSFRRFVP